MKIEVFVLCDAATNYHGKLNILGTFDSIYSKTIPVVYPQCSIALRLRFSQIEEGEHKLKINIVDLDGKSVIQPLNANLKIVFNNNLHNTISTNMILNIQGLKLDKFGEYAIDLAIDGRQEASLPLFLFDTSEKL